MHTAPLVSAMHRFARFVRRHFLDGLRLFANGFGRERRGVLRVHRDRRGVLRVHRNRRAVELTLAAPDDR